MAIKIGLAIAPENALPSAFVVFRDRLEVSIAKAAALGYDGIELALLEKSQVDVERLKALIQQFGLELPVVSTGQVFGEARLWFSHPDPVIRNRAVEQFKGLIEIAAEFGARINIGRVRGPIAGNPSQSAAEDNFLACLAILADYGKLLGVELILEPVNRYEIDYVNTCEEGARIIEKCGHDNVKLMPDVYHMNIEDPSIEGAFLKYFEKISYIHFADSNRYAPGKGHIDFQSVIGTLRALNYQGYVTIEILPYPDPDSAAREAIQYLRKYI